MILILTAKSKQYCEIKKTGIRDTGPYKILALARLGFELMAQPDLNCFKW